MANDANNGQVTTVGLRATAGSRPLLFLSLLFVCSFVFSSVHSKFLSCLAISLAGPGGLPGEVTQIFLLEGSEPFAVTPFPGQERCPLPVIVPMGQVSA